MNLIVDDQKLDRQQERAIYELTLKKQRSKRSTVSHKQVAAMQQLANELLAQRKSSLEMLDLNQDNCNTNLSTSQRRYPSFKTTICRCHSTSALANESLPLAQSELVASKPEEARDTLLEARGDEEHCEESSHIEVAANELTPPNTPSDHLSDHTSSTLVSPQSVKTTPSTKQVLQLVQNHHQSQEYKAAKELQRQSSTSTIATTSTSTSVSSSNSSASTSSSAADNHRNHHHHNHHHSHPCQAILNSSFISSTNSATSISDATSIKLSHLRLEQLNNELERRLHQYEYLVAQEKAILGSYNMNLFANESVNNFHLFARLEHKNIL